MPNLIVSPVGTSVLTQRPADEAVLSLLRNTANKQTADLSEQERSGLESHIEAIRARMANADRDTWRRSSAEVNGILSYGQPSRSDMHVLLGTDTWQGERAADIVADFLRHALNCPVDIVRPRRLSTRSREDFSAGMIEFVKWCGDTLPGYQDGGYKIVFNLTGGFKSVQGYLNTLGMLYADEIIYIFEPPSGELIVIPRLPVRLDEERLAREYSVAFELMSQACALSVESVCTSGIPESLLEFTEMDGARCVGLNVWGVAVWSRLRKDALRGTLLNWPLLQYTAEFEREYAHLGDSNAKAAVQEALAAAAAVLMRDGVNGLRGHGGLQYEDYNWHPGLAHFRVDGGRRISCQTAENGLLLRHVGSHDYVNDNP
ncbi:MAG: hypothetical protein KBC96_14210 [Armatimonadetes bacterium]|nr:hypothetical protein [Armatimonadota bacterium]